jgi:transposase-like protein
MATTSPPHCPNPRCRFHCDPTGWHWVKDGFFGRQSDPLRVQRYRCRHCRRRFSDQTFRLTYWLQRPRLLQSVFHALLACSAYRQVARSLETGPGTVLTHAARLGRHALLFHEQRRPRVLPDEPLVLDSFESFEYSQYHPTLFHVAAGQQSHFFHGFTASELRRSGRMTARQKRRRALLEARHGRPDPRAIERDVAALLGVLAPGPRRLELHTDQHSDYPRALRRLPHLEVEHRTISSRAARTPRNPLFPINLIDLLIRHSSANHKRETIAFSKRRQSAIDRLWVLVVWRNYMKSFSERARGESPAMRLGLLTRRLRAREVLERRLFPERIGLPPAWRRYYRRAVETREIPRCARHRLKYAW